MPKVRFDAKKAVEAVAILAARSPGRKINCKRLLAPLYIANRECLKRMARPLLGGRVAAMRHGPVHTGVNDLFSKKALDEEQDEWTKHFHKDDNFIVLDKDPGVNALSRFETRILADTIEKYEDVADFDLARQTHRYTEYITTYETGKAKTITLEKLVYAACRPALVSSILRELREKQEIDEMFENAKKSPSDAEPTGR